MSREECQCAQEKEEISVCFPPEEDESRVFLLFICPGVSEIWAPLHSRPVSPTRKRRTVGMAWGGEQQNVLNDEYS